MAKDYRDGVAIPAPGAGLLAFGEGGGKGGRTPRIDDNTLQSNHVVRVLEAICEGPVKSISAPYFNEVPFYNEVDGTSNFSGVEYFTRLGLPDQSAIPGFPAQEAEVLVDSKVVTATPVVRTINDELTDAARVSVKIPSLFRMNTDTGDMRTTSVSYRIQYQPNGGVWTDIPGSPFNIGDQKCTSPVFMSHRFNLTGDAPWNVRVARVTADSSEPDTLQNETWFYSLTQIIDQKFTYPHTALLGTIASAEQFGDSIPSRAVLVEGMICDVPTNFDPLTRTYTGVWNGTFKQAWTDCPAWCLRAMVRNKRWGLGRYIPAGYLNDATLYTISQYCAEHVDNGEGGTEPRFSFNAYIASRFEAYQLLNSMASVFRGMIYYSLGAVMFTADMPRDPELTVTRANTVDGEFTYKGASLLTVHNRVNVTFNNPKNFYKRDIVTVEIPEDIVKNGLRPTDIVAFGCTSRSQAVRAGNWLLYTERMESEVLTYIGGPDHTDIGPGSIVRVMDPGVMGVSMGGRLAGYSANSVTLDRPVTLEAGQTYELVVHDRLRKLHYRAITNGSGQHTVIETTVALPDMTANPKETIWALRKTTGPDTLWRVLANREVGRDQYEITALRHDPSKSTIIENGYEIPSFPEPLLPTGPLPIPQNLSVQEFVSTAPGAADTPSVQVAFTLHTDPRVRGYELSYRQKGHGWQSVDMRMNNTAVVSGLEGGKRYNFMIRAYDGTGRQSAWSPIAIVDITGRPVNFDINGVGSFNMIPGFKSLTMGWTNPAIPSFKNVEIWIGSTNVLANATLAATTSSERHVLGGLENSTTYHVWTRVNLHGAAGAQSVRTYQGSATTTTIAIGDLDPALSAGLGELLDTAPPPVPPAPSLSTALGVNGLSTITATVPASIADDFAYFEFRIRQGAGNYVAFLTSTASYSWTVPRGLSHTVSVRAVDVAGNQSSYGSEATITSATDNAPPAVPTGLAATGSFNAISLTWSANADNDLSNYEIYESATTTAPVSGTAATFSTFATAAVRNGFADNVTRHYWIRAVDTSGNKSAWSARVQATTTAVIDLDAVPGAPGAPTYTTTVLGNGRARIVITWAVGSNAIGYNVGITRSGGSEYVVPVQNNRYEFDTVAGAAFSVRVQSVNRVANTSAWTSAVAMTAAVDSTAPAVPTGVSAVAGFGTIWVEWAAVADTDLAFYEVYEHTASTPVPTAGTAATFMVMSNVLNRTGLAEGVTRHYWVRSVDTSGNKSAWSTRVQATTATLAGTQGAPGVPTGVSSTTSLKATGRATIRLSWVEPTNAVSYEVEVTQAGGGGAVIVPVSGPVAEIDAIPGISYDFRVRAVNNVGVKSAFTAIHTRVAATDTTAPGVVTGLTVTAGFGFLWLTWVGVSDTDLAAYEVYESASTTDPTAGTAATITTLSTSFTRSGLAEGVTRHYWVRSVDTSGNRSAWTARVSGTTMTLAGTQTTPAVPTGLSASTSLLADGRATIRVVWSAAANAVSYEVGVTRAGGSESIIPVGGLATDFDALPGVSYDIRVRSVNNVGTRSAFTSVTTSVAASDTTAPGAVTGLTAVAGFGSVWLSWDASAATDLSHYEVYENTTTTAPVAGTNPTFTVSGTGTTRTGLPNNVTRHYWVRAVDTSDNKGLWSARVQATTPANAGITTSDLAGLIDATSFASTIKPVEVVNALPTTGLVDGRQVYLTTDKKMYRYRTSPAGWTAEVDGADIKANTITAGQIAVGAIGADQIAANAIVASKLLIGDTSNLFPDPMMMDDSLYSGTISYVFGNNSENIAGSSTRYLHIPSGQAGEVLSAPIPVERLLTYYVASIMEVNGSGTGEPTLVARFFSNQAGTTQTGSDIIIGSTSSTTWNRQAKNDVTAPSDASSMRLVFQQNVVGSTRHARFSEVVIRRSSSGELVVDGSIKANHLTTTSAVITGTAQIADAVITSAKIVDLAANKITVGALNAGITVGATGTTIGTVETRAADPAARINAGPSTTIVPGKIQISGATTLSDWRMGGDETRINGGEISANTITANKLVVGSRNVTLTGIQFEHNSPGVNQVSWTAGTIRYTNDAGSVVNVSIAAGNATWSSGVVFVYWVKDATSFSTTTSHTTAITNNTIVMATYQGGILLDADFGRTIVDGSSIKTGTITATQLITTAALITANAQIGTGVIQNANIADATIASAKIVSLSADKISVAALNAGITVGATGTTIGTVEGRAADPAARVNAVATVIQPGKIQISGGTTLSDWRMGGDETRINGGEISANTITANKLEIGSRNLTLTGITFEHNSPALNRAAWTAGQIRYVNDAGTSVSASITAGSTTVWSSGVMYIYWVKDATTLSVTTAQATAFGVNNVILATYQGGALLDADFGRTIVDGASIKTGTITASQLVTTSNLITATAQIADAIITSAKIVTLEASKISVGALNAGITVGSTGVSIGTIETRAADPAARVNAGSTVIQPGRIQISGATTLDNWRTTGQTTIDGGMITADSVTATQIAADTITAKQLTIRDFSNYVPNGDMNDPFTTSGAASDVWQSPTTGTITYRDDFPDQGAYSILQQKPSGADSNSVYARGYVPVEEGTEYYAEARYWSNQGASPAGAYFRIRWFDAGKSPLASPAFTDVVSNLGFGTSVTTTGASVAVPAGAKFARFQIYNHSTSTRTNLFWGKLSFRKKSAGNLIVDGSITADHITVTNALATKLATITTAYISDANITGTLAATRIAVGALNAGITIGATGISLGTVETRAADPAARVNANSTLIAPGRIQLSGATTLTSWQMGGDVTRINGGEISANTITANKLEIGSRNVTLTGVTFEHNSPAANQVSWTAGQIRYINDAGTATFVNIAAGSAAWSSGVLYVYWAKDTTTLSTTTAQATAFAVNNLILATYQGGVLLDADFGRTIIDGNSIKTGTITATQIAANAITGDKLVIGSRQVAFSAIRFQANNPSVNSVSWTSGAVRYIDNAGTVQSAAISSGNAAWTSGILYIYWVQGASTLSTTTSQGTAFGANNIVLATYNGGTAMVQNYGQTVVDGANITTGTITADHIAARSISASHLLIGDISNLVLNGDFVDGLGGWGRVTGAGTTRAVYGASPSGYAVSLNRSTGEHSITAPGEWTGANALTGIPVLAGEEFTVDYLAWRGSAVSTAVQVALIIVNSAGTVVQNLLVGNQTITGGATRYTHSGVVTTGGFAFLRFLNNGDGTEVRFCSVHLWRKVKGSLIVNGAIQAGSAIIGTGAIDTLMVAGEAISVTRTYNAAPSWYYSSTMGDVGSWSVTVPHTTTYILDAFILFTGDIGAGDDMTLEINVDGSAAIVNTVTGFAVSSFNGIQVAMTLTAGTHTIALRASMNGWVAIGGNRGINFVQMYVFGAAR